MRRKAFVQACLGMGAIPLVFTDDLMHFTYTAVYNGKCIPGKVWCHPSLTFEDIVRHIQARLETYEHRA